MARAGCLALIVRPRSRGVFKRGLYFSGTQMPHVFTKKSVPLSSIKMKAGKSFTVIFQMASMPSSG
jgi:hypothetical protein